MERLRALAKLVARRAVDARIEKTSVNILNKDESVGPIRRPLRRDKQPSLVIAGEGALLGLLGSPMSRCLKFSGVCSSL